MVSAPLKISDSTPASYFFWDRQAAHLDAIKDGRRSYPPAQCATTYLNIRCYTRCSSTFEHIRSVEVQDPVQLVRPQPSRHESHNASMLLFPGLLFNLQHRVRLTTDFGEGHEDTHDAIDALGRASSPSCFLRRQALP
jgi:hypothetical protein